MIQLIGKETNTDSSEITSYVELTKEIQQEFVNVLNQKIQGDENLSESVKEKRDVAKMLQDHILKKNILNKSDWEFITKELDCVEDNRGQWDYPGECTMINSNRITMKKVEYPLLGIDETGHFKLMKPERDYTFKGKKVFEIPYVGKYKKLIEKIIGI
jgi:hypothetical protein